MSDDALLRHVPHV